LGTAEDYVLKGARAACRIGTSPVGSNWTEPSVGTGDGVELNL